MVMEHLHATELPEGNNVPISVAPSKERPNAQAESERARTIVVTPPGLLFGSLPLAQAVRAISVGALASLESATPGPGHAGLPLGQPTNAASSLSEGEERPDFALD
ncbi:hypothetical protein BU26DRAFT_518960 [Trematosphaeria pertusa]|uniref:Uncharacterized protein n=1 Tax=Trematosphaeria pertusa TaxID=390896 RepID=A0A6A6IGS8_9PLEO|nr:uncharacterized protein BU26DRAFT_518960 [Trematosphaeria pertusa]KAF2248743.1 hypothetical protein BU26DRAFT_518960 [Trematosphaeria pertusa]